jgi:hypothetical protein
MTFPISTEHPLLAFLALRALLAEVNLNSNQHGTSFVTHMTEFSPTMVASKGGRKKPDDKVATARESLAAGDPLLATHATSFIAVCLIGLATIRN